MTNIANDTDEARNGGSALDDGLGFAAYTKEHFAWVSQLKSGDKVDILHPWDDGEVKGGRRTPSEVEEISFLYSGERMIHIKGFHVFYSKSGGGSYQTIMPPN